MSASVARPTGPSTDRPILAMAKEHGRFTQDRPEGFTMLADRYDLPLSTASAAARDAYVQGCNLALTLYPGAVDAFDRAIVADPVFALAHAAKAQVLMREGIVAEARAALAAAKNVAGG